MTSADRDAWVALATAFREQIAAAVPLVGAMAPGEAKTLVEAADAALALHQRAEQIGGRVGFATPEGLPRE